MREVLALASGGALLLALLVLALLPSFVEVVGDLRFFQGHRDGGLESLAPLFSLSLAIIDECDVA